MQYIYIAAHHFTCRANTVLEGCQGELCTSASICMQQRPNERAKTVLRSLRRHLTVSNHGEDMHIALAVDYSTKRAGTRRRRMCTPGGSGLTNFRPTDFEAEADREGSPSINRSDFSRYSILQTDNAMQSVTMRVAHNARSTRLGRGDAIIALQLLAGVIFSAARARGSKLERKRNVYVTKLPCAAHLCSFCLAHYSTRAPVGDNACCSRDCLYCTSDAQQEVDKKVSVAEGTRRAGYL